MWVSREGGRERERERPQIEERVQRLVRVYERWGGVQSERSEREQRAEREQRSEIREQSARYS